MAKAKPQMDEAAFNAILKKKATGAFAKGRTTEAKPRGSRLPDGLVGAIAQFTGLKYGLTKKTQDPWFMFMGVVKKPEQYRGVQMNIGHFLNPTDNKTADDKMELLCSDCKLLEIEMDETTQVGGLLKLMKERLADKPHFEFTTWKPDNGDTMCFLQGVVKDFVDEVAADEVIPDAAEVGGEIADDSSQEVEEIVEEAPPAKPKPSTKPAATKPPAKPASKPAAKPKPKPVEEEVVEDVVEEPAQEEERIPQVDDVFEFRLKPEDDLCDVAIVAVDEPSKSVDIRFMTGPNKGKGMKKLKWNRLGG